MTVDIKVIPPVSHYADPQNESHHQTQSENTSLDHSSHSLTPSKQTQNSENLKEALDNALSIKDKQEKSEDSTSVNSNLDELNAHDEMLAVQHDLASAVKTPQDFLEANKSEGVVNETSAQISVENKEKEADEIQTQSKQTYLKINNTRTESLETVKSFQNAMNLIQDQLKIVRDLPFPTEAHQKYENQLNELEKNMADFQQYLIEFENEEKEISDGKAANISPEQRITKFNKLHDQYKSIINELVLLNNVHEWNTAYDKTRNTFFIIGLIAAISAIVIGLLASFTIIGAPIAAPLGAVMGAIAVIMGAGPYIIGTQIEPNSAKKKNTWLSYQNELNILNLKLENFSISESLLFEIKKLGLDQQQRMNKAEEYKEENSQHEIKANEFKEENSQREKKWMDEIAELKRKLAENDQVQQENQQKIADQVVDKLIAKLQALPINENQSKNLANVLQEVVLTKDLTLETEKIASPNSSALKVEEVDKDKEKPVAGSESFPATNLASFA